MIQFDKYYSDVLKPATALPETNIAPENFKVRAFSFREGSFVVFGLW